MTSCGASCSARCNAAVIRPLYLTATASLRLRLVLHTPQEAITSAESEALLCPRSRRSIVDTPCYTSPQQMAPQGLKQRPRSTKRVFCLEIVLRNCSECIITCCRSVRSWHRALKKVSRLQQHMKGGRWALLQVGLSCKHCAPCCGYCSDKVWWYHYCCLNLWPLPARPCTTCCWVDPVEI